MISDPHGRYYGIEVSERALVPDNDRATRRDPFRILADTVCITNCECASSASAVAAATMEQESHKRAS